MTDFGNTCIDTIHINKNINDDPVIETTTDGNYVIENMNEIGKEEMFAIIIAKLNEVINKINNL